jgi:hypothetical protein
MHIICVTGCRMKNITLSIDDDLLEKGREYARSHNISLNVLVRRLLEQAVVRKESGWVDDMFRLMDKANVSSKGKRWTRDELYRV